MVASVAGSAFFPPASVPSALSVKASAEGSESLNVRGIVAKPISSPPAMEVKARAKTVPKVNGTKVGLKSEAQKVDEDSSSGSRTFYNQLPDWSFLFAALTTIFLAAEKQFTLLDWKPKRPDMLADAFGLGKIVEDGRVFRQNFFIRSYEIGADRTASIETFMNHLQETALNHVKVAGLMGDGFGSTPEMCKRNLIWVVTKMQVRVERYPTWEDIVQVNTWVGSSGKNGMRRDWHICDNQTGETILRASSLWVMMNKETRRLSKMPEEVRREISPHFVDSPIVEEDSRKLPKLDDKTADYVRTGLTPRWSDLDINQHVNNVKYIGWILESAPSSILESHELAGMTLEYRRECGRDSVLQSLSVVSNDRADGIITDAGIECHHLLRLESGEEVVRGRTEWRPKRSNALGDIMLMPAESA